MRAALRECIHPGGHTVGDNNETVMLPRSSGLRVRGHIAWHPAGLAFDHSRAILALSTASLSINSAAVAGGHGHGHGHHFHGHGHGHGHHHGHRHGSCWRLTSHGLINVCSIYY